MAYGARDPTHTEAIIRQKMLKVLPQLEDVNIDYTWTGNFLLTLSRLPQFGRLAITSKNGAEDAVFIISVSAIHRAFNALVASPAACACPAWVKSFAASNQRD